MSDLLTVKCGCSETILGVLQYGRAEPGNCIAVVSARDCIRELCVWPPTYWIQDRKTTPEEQARGHIRGKGRVGIVRRKKKKSKSKEAPRGALIVAEDNSSGHKKTGCEAEYLGDTQVSEISHHFCIWCFPYSSKKMTHLTRVLMKSTTTYTLVYLHVHFSTTPDVFISQVCTWESLL